MIDDRSALVREFSAPLAAAKGWMKFLGIVFIIQGALTALSIIGIVVAWLPIWIGVLLLQASSAAERARVSGDEIAFRQSLEKLRTYFVIQGVLMLIGIALTIVMFLVYGAVIGTMLHSGGFH